MLTVAATGHRPPKLGGYGDDVFNRCITLVKQHFRLDRPKHVITGMALGWDQAVAQACVDFDIPYTAAIPFEDQENMWPIESQLRYRRLLAWAERIQIVSERNAMPAAKALQVRNEWMVDRSDSVLALWDGSFGGTHNCIVYAKKQHRPITNLWEKFDGLRVVT